jgi:hypothetical protein
MNCILKNVSRIVLCFCIALAAQSCIVHKKTVHTNTSTKPLPPGQAKKVTGSQSAKEYAPGQVKKETGSQSSKEAPGQQKKKK